LIHNIFRTNSKSISTKNKFVDDEAKESGKKDDDGEEKKCYLDSFGKSVSLDEDANDDEVFEYTEDDPFEWIRGGAIGFVVFINQLGEKVRLNIGEKQFVPPLSRFKIQGIHLSKLYIDFDDSSIKNATQQDYEEALPFHRRSEHSKHEYFFDPNRKRFPFRYPPTIHSTGSLSHHYEYIESYQKEPHYEATKYHYGGWIILPQSSRIRQLRTFDPIPNGAQFVRHIQSNTIGLTPEHLKRYQRDIDYLTKYLLTSEAFDLISLKSHFPWYHSDAPRPKTFINVFDTFNRSKVEETCGGKRGDSIHTAWQAYSQEFSLHL